MALLLAACGSTDTKSTAVVGPTSATENPIYVDFASQSSSDGQKVAFLSRRDAGAYRVYLYNGSVEPKLVALNKSITLEPNTDELATSLSDDGSWSLTWRFNAEKNHLLLNSFDALQQITLSVDNDARLRDLALAPSGKRFLSYTQRKGGVDTVRVYSFTDTGTPVLTDEASFAGEYGAQFAVVGSDLYLFTRKSASAGQVTVQSRKSTGAGQWALDANTLTLAASDANGPSTASALGLLYAKKLDAVRLKPKLGTFSERPEGYQLNVGVAQGVEQFKAFSSTAFDALAPSYLTNEPLTVGTISATADGAYFLITGYDAWFCKTRTQPSNVLLLVRVSDGAVLPLLVNRTTGTVPWTGLASEPCSYYDQASFPVFLDFDTSLSSGQLLSVTNNKVQIVYESKITGDREVRRLSFEVTDWAAKTYSKAEFTDISANPKL